MNINQDPVSRRESTPPPTPQEREAMRATREQVRTDEASRREVSTRRTEASRAEARQEKDRIEISVEARRRAAAADHNDPSRRKTLQRLKQAYNRGELGTSERRMQAANRMLEGPERPNDPLQDV